MIMKQILFSLLALLSVNLAWADDVTVPDVEIAPGQTSYVDIYLNVDSKTIYGGFQLDVTLPEKIIVPEVTYEDLGEGGQMVEVVGPDGELGKELQTAKFNLSRRFINGDSQHMRYLSFAMGATMNKDNVDNLLLLRIPVNADASLSAGDRLQGNMFDIKLQSPAGTVLFDDITVNFIITDYINLFDYATKLPANNTQGNFVVHRTIKANEWSTICLPFAMTGDQVAKAFGEDVKFADFAGADIIDGENIHINFTTVDAVNAGTKNYRPYIIKVSKAIDQFRVDNATIKRAGSNVAVGTYKFSGTVVPTTIPAQCLYLSDNKFYYSIGKTETNGFRAYFDLGDDVLDEYWDAAEVKVNLVLDDVTKIENIDNINSNGDIYNLNGIKIGTDQKNLGKGIYIVNGKKIVK